MGTETKTNIANPSPDETVVIPLAAITALAGLVVVGLRAAFAGTIESVAGTVNAAFTVSDIVITSKINSTGVTNGVVTIPTAASAALTTATASPTAAKTFAVGDIINFTVTGGVGTVGGAITLVLRRA